MEQRHAFPLLFALAALLAAGCESDTETSDLNPRSVRIYSGSTTVDQVVVDAVGEADGELTLFGVCGNGLEDKYSSGSLFMQRIGRDGRSQWDSCSSAVPDGFPTNVVRLEDAYYLFWNYTTEGGALQQRALKIDENGSILSNEVFLGGETGFLVVKLTANAARDGLILLALSEQDAAEEREVIVNEVDLDYRLQDNLAMTRFRPGAFDVFTDDDVNTLPQLERYFNLGLAAGTPFYTAPSLSGNVVLRFAGDTAAVQQSDSLFYVAVTEGEAGFAAAFENQQAKNQLRLATQLALSADEPIEDRLLEQEIIIETAETLTLVALSNGDLLLVGTTVGGEAFLLATDAQGRLVRQETLGHAYPYLTKQVVYDPPTVYLVGHTEVQNQFLRPFVIALDEGQLR